MLLDMGLSYIALKIDKPFDSTISLLGINQKEMKSAYERGAYASIFITGKVMLGLLHVMWNQPKCVSEVTR